MTKRHKTVGETLKSWRLARGMSQQKLADLIGCKGSEICHYEKGRSPADERHAKFIEVTEGAVRWR